MKNTNNNQTEIGEVSEVLLQDYCDVIQYGYTQSASEKEVGPKFLRITDIQNKPINWNEVPYCEISEKDLKKYLLETGDIVIARTGASTGTNAIYDSKKMPQSVFASYLIRLKLNEEFDPLYVHYFLQSPFYKEHIAGILGGSAQPNANAQQLTNVQITKFDPDYQRQITTVLSSLDDKIELNRRMNKTLEDMGKTLFKRWFVNFEFPNEEGKPYKSSGGGMVESKLGEIPQGWKIKDLGEIFEINTKSINPSKHPDQVFWHFSIPSYDQYGSPTSEAGVTIKSNKTQIQDRSILVSKLNPKQEVRVWSVYAGSWGGNAISSTEFINFVPDGKDWAFANFLFRNEDFYNRFADMSTGSTGSRQRVRPTEAKKLNFVYPSEHARLLFNSVIEPVLVEIDKNARETMVLKELRDSLLPRLMSGKLRVN